jgi:hypothetical protein
VQRLAVGLGHARPAPEACAWFRAEQNNYTNVPGI